ncbi:MAG: nitroreductase [Muribaculaceae bacterium]|nr:nitroreductase [Muribaculaceae bacterium]
MENTLNEELIQAIESRHSVRHYTDRPIDSTVVAQLNGVIDQCNREGNLRIQLVLEDSRTFGSFMVHYGAFSGVRNYFAIVGKGEKLSERAGYYGERLVLEAQRLGLNTCWVALTYSKKRCRDRVNFGLGERLVCVIALGYGVTQGHGHKVKTFEQVTRCQSDVPQWFRNGVQAALLAPTAVGQQQFRFHLLDNNRVRAVAKIGFYTHIDLGIVKLHFELGAGVHNFTWAE